MLFLSRIQSKNTVPDLTPALPSLELCYLPIKVPFGNIYPVPQFRYLESKRHWSHRLYIATYSKPLTFLSVRNMLTSSSSLGEMSVLSTVVGFRAKKTQGKKESRETWGKQEKGIDFKLSWIVWEGSYTFPQIGGSQLSSVPLF